MTLVPGVAVSVPPKQADDTEALAGVAITMPVGRLSVKFRKNAGDGLALLSIVNVSVLRLPRAIGLGEKPLVKPGRVVTTIRSSLAVP